MGLVNLAVTILAITTLTLTSCRSTRQSNNDDNTRTLIVKPSGLPEPAKVQTQVNFELSQCVPAVFGQFSEGGVIKVTAPGIRKSQVCTVKGKAVTPSKDDEFIGEQGIYYLAKDVLVKEDATGSLYTNANFQKMYKVKVDPLSGFTLSVPVAFPEKPNAFPLTATLSCAPPMGQTADLTTATTSGVFKFAIAAKDTKHNYVCSEIKIKGGGAVQAFDGNFNPAFSFDVVAGGAASTPEVKLHEVMAQPDDIDTEIEPAYELPN